MTTPDLWRFVLTTTPFVLSPGASTAVLVRNTAQDGRAAGIRTGLGLAGGCVFYGAVTSMGAGIVLERWPSSAGVLRLVGAAYIAWLGCRSLYAAWATARPVSRGTAQAPAARRRRFVVEGFLTSALNPSVALFYLLVLSQFAAGSTSIVRAVALLTAVHVTMALSWYAAWIATTSSVASRAASPGMPRAFHLAIGLVLILLAVRLAA